MKPTTNNTRTNQPPMTALYARLSHDDEQQGDSVSIANQKRILESYAKEHDLSPYRFYVDDGWSGANFQRPGFTAMMDAIDRGEIKCVVVKDLSRMGRNYLQVGVLTELTFPKNGVRFIAINDGVDSDAGDNDITPLKNLFNEWLVRDTSRKIKAVVRAKGMRGIPITRRPVYGYKKGADGRFVVDEERAQVVRRIYNMCIGGYGPCQIARILNDEHVPSPGALGEDAHYVRKGTPLWTPSYIGKLLECREYLGHTVNFKTEKLSYKAKIVRVNSEEQRMVFEHTHEAIIDQDTWDRVQALRLPKKHPTRYGEVGMFSGMLYCADCGSRLQRHYTRGRYHRDIYTCGLSGSHRCTAHYIRTDVLTQGVADNLRSVTAFAEEHEQALADLLRKQCNSEDQRALAARQKEFAAAEKRLNELSTILRRLYEDNVMGRITDEQFAAWSVSYQQEQTSLAERVVSLRASISEAQASASQVDRFLSVVHRYAHFDELTPAVLHELVDHIVVHEPVRVNGERHQDIDIYYAFVGKVAIPLVQ